MHSNKCNLYSATLYYFISELEQAEICERYNDPKKKKLEAVQPLKYSACLCKEVNLCVCVCVCMRTYLKIEVCACTRNEVHRYYIHKEKCACVCEEVHI